MGGLGIQYCIKTKKAYEQLTENKSRLISVDYNEFNPRYNQRDNNARIKMKELIDSDDNRLENVFSTLLRGGK